MQKYATVYREQNDPHFEDRLVGVVLVICEQGRDGFEQIGLLFLCI